MRKEFDSMGEMEVPDNAYYGAQTQRAIENFPVSGLKIPKSLIKSLGMIKRSAAIVNYKLGYLDKSKSNAIIEACDEVIAGKFDKQFLVDVFQTGSGTSSNMNTNEVIANRASEIMGGEIGTRKPVHPNDHVNFGQSSNDVIPTSIHVAANIEIENKLIPSLEILKDALFQKSKEFHSILKIGRTHLQDATPIRLGQEFSGYAKQIENNILRLKNCKILLSELAQGGTAVGTGINTHKDFGKLVAIELSQYSGVQFKEAPNHFEAQAAQDAAVETSGVLKTLAVSLSKISNDIRWLGSGPRSGLGELSLPVVQPGSSIMPGKVNPVICESMIQACAQVIGNDTVITLGGMGGIFELNLMLPVIAHNLLQSIDILNGASKMFTNNVVVDLKANEQICKDYIEGSLAMCTSLAPVIGYDKAANIAHKAYETGKTVREIALEQKILPENELKKLLDPILMTKPNS